MSCYWGFTHYHYAQIVYRLGEEGYGKLFPDSMPAGRLTWSKYRAAVIDRLAARQAADGSWPSAEEGPGVLVSTAWCLAILQLDKSTLPIYQR
jgi:hypothetical protein